MSSTTLTKFNMNFNVTTKPPLWKEIVFSERRFIHCCQAAFTVTPQIELSPDSTCQAVDKTRIKMERKLNMLVLVEESCQARLASGKNVVVKYMYSFLRVLFEILNWDITSSTAPSTKIIATYVTIIQIYHCIVLY